MSVSVPLSVFRCLAVSLSLRLSVYLSLLSLSLFTCGGPSIALSHLPPRLPVSVCNCVLPCVCLGVCICVCVSVPMCLRPRAWPLIPRSDRRRRLQQRQLQENSRADNEATSQGQLVSALESKQEHLATHQEPDSTSVSQPRMTITSIFSSIFCFAKSVNHFSHLQQCHVLSSLGSMFSQITIVRSVTTTRGRQKANPAKKRAQGSL